MIIFLGFLFWIVFMLIIGALISYPLLIGVFWLIDIVTLLSILLPIIFFFCVTKSGRFIGGYIKSSFKRNHQYNAAELENIARAAKNTVKIALAAGWFNFLIAFIMIFVINTDFDPEFMIIGASFALSVLSLLYSISIAFFMFFPLQAWAENKASLIKRED